MYKGTYEGNIEEIKFVSFFNTNKDLFYDYISQFKKYSNLWMVRVTTKQFSKLSRRKVYTRSDCYLANFDCDIIPLLIENDYYLSEEILTKSNTHYVKIPNSGISIKMTNSSRFQILKVGPDSFNTLFGSYELGAGASLFCKENNELYKNHDLIKCWESSINEMTTYFDKFTNGDTSFYLDQEICKKIKSFSCKEIKKIIEESPELQKKIFNGIGLYEEPYTAQYFYHGKNIVRLTMIPFSVTTGSGRSKGNYTIVLKP